MPFPTRIGVDEEGYIVNDTSLHKINQEYMHAIHQLIEMIKPCLSGKLHSIYVYGSVGRGNAIVGKSDIDLSMVLEAPLTIDEKDNLANETERFLSKNPQIPKVDYDFGLLTDIQQKGSEFYWGFWLRHMCTCILGGDLSVHFPPMKPNVHTCKRLNEDLVETLQNYRETLQTEKDTDFFRKSVLKRIVRGAYCLVAVKDQSWATKIDEQLVILDYYFSEEVLFKKLATYVVDGKAIARDELSSLIDRFICWYEKQSFQV